MTENFSEIDQLRASYEQLVHDLRTPLGSCLGVLEDLVAGYKLSDDEIRDGRDAARKMVEILNNIREQRAPGEE